MSVERSVIYLQLMAWPILWLCLPMSWARRGRDCPRWVRQLKWQWKRQFCTATRSVLFVTLCSFAFAGLLSWVKAPVMSTHDEFVYELAAETYAAGRMTNPTPPSWRHFEAPHVLLQPTYSSKYPPVQGLFMAAGLCLSGSSLTGIWLSTALAAGTLTWMLCGLVRPSVAAVWGLAFGLHPLLQISWGQGYWGGASTLIGGALAYGAVIRLSRTPSLLQGVNLGLGLLVLANSRPLEGLVASLTACFWLLCQILKRLGDDSPLRWIPAMTACVLLLLAGASGMAAQNQAITGSAWKLPYQVHHQQYGASPVFLFQHAWQPIKHDDPMISRFFNENAVTAWEAQQRFSGWLAHKLYVAWLFSLMGPSLAGWLLLIQLRRARQSIVWTLLLPAVALNLAVSSMTTWLQFHYLAPVVPVGIAILVLIGDALLSSTISHRRYLLIVLGLQLVTTAALPAIWSRCPQPVWALQRRAVLSQLNAKEGKHLVFVRYSGKHHPYEEWVYNSPDIQTAKVVWARMRPLEENRRLTRYLPDRQVWLLEPDRLPIQLRPYLKDRSKPQ